MIFGEWIVPVWRELCECPDVVNASINCVRKYDGALLYVLKEVERTRFEEMVQKMDWRALNLVIHGVLSTLCKVNGSDCLDKMTELLASGNGRVLVNTFKGEDGCLSLKRVEEEITGVLMSLVGSIESGLVYYQNPKSQGFKDNMLGSYYVCSSNLSTHHRFTKQTLKTSRLTLKSV